MKIHWQPTRDNLVQLINTHTHAHIFRKLFGPANTGYFTYTSFFVCLFFHMVFTLHACTHTAPMCMWKKISDALAWRTQHPATTVTHENHMKWNSDTTCMVLAGYWCPIGDVNISDSIFKNMWTSGWFLPAQLVLTWEGPVAQQEIYPYYYLYSVLIAPDNRRVLSRCTLFQWVYELHSS